MKDKLGLIFKKWPLYKGSISRTIHVIKLRSIYIYNSYILLNNQTIFINQVIINSECNKMALFFGI